MSSLAPRLIDEAEFLSLAESTERLELIDGEVILSPSPSFRHQRLLRRVVRALEDWADTQQSIISIGIAPLDVRFAPGRILQPTRSWCSAAYPMISKGRSIGCPRSVSRCSPAIEPTIA